MSAETVAARNALVVRRKSSAVGNVVGAFESETAAVFLRTAPARQHIVLYVLVGILVLSIGLSAVVKLDRVVTSAGRIVPTAGELYVTPFDTGIVRQVNVKAGDVVKKGQVLATLDPTFTRADLLQLQQKQASDEAAVARLEAELSGKKYKFSAADPAQSLQGGIWQKRQAEYQIQPRRFRRTDSFCRGAGGPIPSGCQGLRAAPEDGPGCRETLSTLAREGLRLQIAGYAGLPTIAQSAVACWRMRRIRSRRRARPSRP